MSNLLRIEGEGDWIETLRSELLAGGVAVSEVHNVSLDSKQLSTPWSSPEVIELLKFVTAALQTSAATFVLLKTIRDALGTQRAAVVQQQESGAQLKITKDTTDNALKDFAERN